jgi:hypothetical protein
MIWKIWTENQSTKEAGGLYLFSDAQSAESYITKHSERLKGFGINRVNVKIFDVNLPLTNITKGPFKPESRPVPPVYRGIRSARESNARINLHGNSCLHACMNLIHQRTLAH